jgi:RNA-directed DNA polymerase
VEKQMTGLTQLSTGASTANAEDWDAINWQKAKADVRRLQIRIAKAYREKKYNKAKSLQWILTHSRCAKLLAVKRVTSNQGAKTPGVDKVKWSTSKQKINAVLSLRRHGYKALPLRRIQIPKKQKGQYRPLSIPTMECRAMQALYLLALEPIAESISDQNAYGFRPKRCAADAIRRCFLALAKKGSAEYILEADLKACFDNISHEWLLKNVPMDKRMLKSWLKAGFISDNQYFDTHSGTAQGGIISPTLLNIVLSGLEKAALSTFSKYRNRQHKVYLSIYADDFIITGASREVLEKRVKPEVEKFLSDRGLTLSQEKTKITHIDDGFDFLGSNIRKYNGKLIIKPTKEGINTFLRGIQATIKSHPTVKAENLIRILNPKIRGWTNYHRHSCAKKTFGYIEHRIFGMLWQWAKRRHPNKGLRWVRRKYFRSRGLRNWVFSAKVKGKDGTSSYLDLVNAGAVKIQRHTKIKADATPFDPKFVEYFVQRAQWKNNFKALDTITS